MYDPHLLWKSMGQRGDVVRKAPEPGRNDSCHCGSGKKYKKRSVTELEAVNELLI